MGICRGGFLMSVFVFVCFYCVCFLFFNVMLSRLLGDWTTRRSRLPRASGALQILSLHYLGIRNIKNAYESIEDLSSTDSKFNTFFFSTPSFNEHCMLPDMLQNCNKWIRSKRVLKTCITAFFEFLQGAWSS